MGDSNVAAGGSLVIFLSGTIMVLSAIWFFLTGQTIISDDPLCAKDAFILLVVGLIGYLTLAGLLLEDSDSIICLIIYRISYLICIIIVVFLRLIIFCFLLPLAIIYFIAGTIIGIPDTSEQIEEILELLRSK